MREPAPHRRRSRALALAALTGVTLGFSIAHAAPEKVSGGIRFSYLDARAKAVLWAGAFNGWSTSATPMTRAGDGVWSVVVALPAGEQQYKFVVDGQWMTDPSNPVTGGDFGNSVIVVGADGGIVTQRATSNTPYTPKILIGGRTIALYQTDYDHTFGRYELTRPVFDMDLDFGIRVSEVMQAHALLNINPAQEDVQDFRSRLNLKRGSLTVKQAGLEVRALDSEIIGTWDDPLELVGGMGQFHHPYGWQRQGVDASFERGGFDGEILYTDNFDDRQITNSDIYLAYRIDNFPTFVIGPTNRPVYTFELDPIGKAVALLQTQASGAGYALVRGQASKVLTVDAGDNGRLFGYGDNNKNTSAARVQRTIAPNLRAALLARTDRGFSLGRMAFAQPTGDSSIRVLNTLYSQEWYGGGGALRWTPSTTGSAYAELLAGARRMSFVNGSNALDYRVTTMSSSGVRVATGQGASGQDSIVTTGIDGTHLTTDRSVRGTLGGAWTFAQGDVGLRASVTAETHNVPRWTQSPSAPSGVPNTDHPRFETVEFQRVDYLQATDELHDHGITWHLGWDRNWRYYLGREVTTALDVEWTDFRYDAGSAWEHQLWFPTGNFWLENGQGLVSVDRLTVLGEPRVIRVTPVIDVPIRRKRDVHLTYRGRFDGVSLSKAPRYAESRLQLGFDVTRTLRFGSDTRWVKYDAPLLGLGRSYVSTFNGLTLTPMAGIEVSLGFGVDPRVLDPVTNEYADIGREVFLNDRNANGFIAETNYFSLAPQISAAERALQDTRRIQLQAVVHY